MDTTALQKSFMKNERIFLYDQLEPYLSDYIYVLEYTLKDQPSDVIKQTVEKLKAKWTFDPNFTQSRKLVFQTLDEMSKPS